MIGARQRNGEGDRRSREAKQPTGQIDAAIEHLRKGAKLAPTYPPIWEHLGLAYVTKGQHRDAITSFERATKLKPDYQQAWQHLADEYRIVGRPAEAQQVSAQAARLQSRPAVQDKKEKLTTRRSRATSSIVFRPEKREEDNVADRFRAGQEHR